MRKKQNGGWKLSDTDWFYFSFYNPSFFFMIRVDPSPILVYFYFLFHPSWSESIRVDPTRTGGPSWSGPTFVPAWLKSTYSSYEEMKGCRRIYKLNTQMQKTKSETRYKKKIKKKEQSHCAWLISGFPLQQIRARCNERRRALLSSKNQIDGVLGRIFIHSHCKVRSHNFKGGCAFCEKKKESLFSITHIGPNI